MFTGSSNDTTATGAPIPVVAVFTGSSNAAPVTATLDVTTGVCPAKEIAVNASRSIATITTYFVILIRAPLV